MPRQNITEQTEAEDIVRDTSRFFRSVSATTPVIPGSFNGKYALMLVVATDSEATEAQMDALETAIEAITGVHKAFVMIGPARIPLDRVPVDHDLRFLVEGIFSFEPTPVLRLSDRFW